MMKDLFRAAVNACLQETERDPQQYPRLHDESHHLPPFLFPG